MLTDAEMERKFQECSISNALEGCEQKRTDREPGIASTPPYSSVVHRREHGVSFNTPSGELVALIFFWKGPDGEDRRSIRMFVCPVCGHIYKRKSPNLAL